LALQRAATAKARKLAINCNGFSHHAHKLSDSREDAWQIAR
jgi:hypothetical protein